MKNILFCLSLFISLTAYSTRYLVQLEGTNRWPLNTTTGSIITIGNAQSLNSWITSTSFKVGDEIWLAAGTYIVDNSIIMPNGVNLYGGFSGTEGSINDRSKLSGGKSWEFNNPTIIDGNNQVNQGIVTLANNLSSTFIDGVTITKFKSTNPTSNISGVGASILTNWLMQNCIVSYNTSTNNLFESRGTGVYVRGGQLLNSYIHHNENLKSGTASTYGGGVFASSTESITTLVKGCTIEFNTATSNGGGVAFGNDNTIQTTAIQSVHDLVWSKRVDSSGIIVDFIGEMPTPEDCTLGRPNALGWYCPIENGPMFTGVYLAAQCERARRSNDAVDRKNASRLAQGLINSASVSDVKGFIARGMGTDGICHYPIGSDDQTHPWFYGLHAYLMSNIPDAAERTQITNKMIEVAAALELTGWQCPCDGTFKGQFRGSFKVKDYRAASRYLFMLRAMYDVTKDSTWLTKYNTAVNEIPPGATKTRLQICAEGYIPDVVAKSSIAEWSLWTYVGSQASLSKLIAWEKNDSIKAQYKLGLSANVTSALVSLDKYKLFDNNDTKVFGTANWRLCFPTWYAQTTITDAINLSNTGDKTAIGLRKNFEAQYMRNPLAAAAIVALSLPIDGRGRDAIQNCIKWYDYTKINISEFFYAEVAYYALP